MKISWSWIKDYLDPNPNALDLIDDILIQAGIEFSYYNPYSTFDIVTIDSISKIDGAKKLLNLCKIQDKQIVCGADNAKKGLRCICANIGSIIPKNGMIIKESILFGQLSQGMLCGCDELLLSNDDGLYEVKDNEDILAKLTENGPFFNLELTPNRGDLLSAYGIARELAAFGLGTLKSIKDFDINFTLSNNYINIDDHDAVKAMHGIRIDIGHLSDTPDFIKKRLYEIGIYAKNSIVDVTNYVAHDLGQPLHAFDYKITGRINFAKASGEFKDLKGDRHTISGICCAVSNDTIHAIPGIIGGDESKITNQTLQILLDAGIYSQMHICTGKKVVETDASKKFLHGVDYNITRIAIARAASMICQINSGHIIGAEIIKQYQSTQKLLKYNKNIVDLDLDQDYIDLALHSLGFSKIEDSYSVPSWRDHSIYADENITEEVLRIYGYENIPEIEVKYKPQQIKYDTVKLPIILAALGLNEIHTYDFMSKKMNQYFKQDKSLYIANPMKSDNQFCMRNSLLPNLIETASTYIKYNWTCKGLFEINNIFTSEGEFKKCGILIFEDDCNWLQDNKMQYFRAKEIFETALHALYSNFYMKNINSNILAEQCMFFDEDMNEIGVFGVLSQGLKDEFKLRNNIYLGEFFVKHNNNIKQYNTNFTDLMHITRDISFYLPNNLTYHEVYAAIKESLNNFNVEIFNLDDNNFFPETLLAAQEHLISKTKQLIHDFDIKLFDIYPDLSISNSNRSYAIRITLNSIPYTPISGQIHLIIAVIEEKLINLGCKIKE